MRAITIDTKGFLFSTKILLPFVFLTSLWFSWTPLTHFISSQRDDFKTSSAQGETSNEEQVGGYAETGVLNAQNTRGMYLVVDIERKHVALHAADGSVKEFEITRIPEDSSLDEVAQGTYTVDEKVKTELSTVSMTRFPYYISFGDRYAFHGTPTDAEGKSLQEGYVGGLIELTTENAKRIFDEVEMGTPIEVKSSREKMHTATSSNGTATGTSVSLTDGLPATSAEAYAIADVANGQIFLDKSGNEKYPIASITKLVTALTATDVIGHGTEVRAPNGEYYTLGDLYYPLLLRSDNAVANSIAKHAGTTYFMSNMNAYAQARNMSRTSFTDPSGLSPKNISTALDLVKLAQHLYTEKSFLLDFSKEEHMTITSTKGEQWSMKNQNVLATDPHFRGGKLGFTDEAEQTSLAIFNVPIHGEVRPIAVVILHSKDWKQDTRTLLKWLVENTKDGAVSSE